MHGTDYRLNIFVLGRDVKQLAGTEGKVHGLLELAEVVKDLRGDQGRKLPVREGLIFVQFLAAIQSVPCISARSSKTHILDTESAISAQYSSTRESSFFKA